MTNSGPPTWRAKEPIAVRFGRKLRLMRDTRGIVQLKLAMTANLDRSYISELENGLKEPTLGTLEKFAIAFNTSISDLLEGV